ncbi:hypothetical protein DSO57_1027427 [Entomophthora muscae]|uniref:Uncharacterized protein n=1 Tax=Entomophthora muscae TaxID=34485 RepID=A0ACC2TCW8_9FUNG|nr:hypothetical protein DSO57_1027427 [Entomophthora muscae]
MVFKSGQHQANKQSKSINVSSKEGVRNIPDTYSCVTNKLSPAINVKAPATTKQMSDVTEQTSATMQKPATTKLSPAVNTQVPAATKQIHATTTQKPATSKLLPTVNTQASATTKQMSTAPAQTSAVAKQVHTATTQKPTTTKLLPTVNVQTPATIEKITQPLRKRPPLLPAPPERHLQTRHP